jgi:hypothetical protein
MKEEQYKKLEGMQGNLEEQQKMIAYLQDLDALGDPAFVVSICLLVVTLHVDGSVCCERRILSSTRWTTVCTSTR